MTFPHARIVQNDLWYLYKVAPTIRRSTIVLAETMDLTYTEALLVVSDVAVTEAKRAEKREGEYADYTDDQVDMVRYFGLVGQEIIDNVDHYSRPVNTRQYILDILF